MAEFFRSPFTQVDNSAGSPLAGATLEFYTATTTTPITVYQNNALSASWGSIVTADSAGLFPPIFINSTANPLYKFILKNSAGTIIQTVDSVVAASAGSSSFADDVFRVTDNVDATKALAFQVSGVTAGQTRTLTVPDASGTIALTTDITTAINRYADPRRNRIPNPANQISTVNGNTAGTTNGYAPADGVNIYRVTSAGTITVQRVQSVTPKGSRDRVRITITAADASLAAGEYLTHTRNLTGNENADLQWGTASAKQINDRFLFKGPAGTYAVSYKNYNAGTPNRSYIALFTPAVANTDEIITIVVPGDTSGTWETGTNPAIVRDITLAAGATFQGTTGWQAGNILGTSAVTNGMGTINNVFEIAEEGLYLDPNSTGVAPAWELPSYQASYDYADVTPWVAYTPTITGFGTATSIVARSRRVGDTLEVDVKFTSGTPTGVEARLTLGFNGVDGSVTIDSTKVPSIMIAGMGAFNYNFGGALTVLAESGTAYMTFGAQGGSNAGLTKILASGIANSGNILVFNARFPITGW